MVDSEPGIFNIYSPETSQDIKAKPDLKVDDTNKEDSHFDGDEDTFDEEEKGATNDVREKALYETKESDTDKPSDFENKSISV